MGLRMDHPHRGYRARQKPGAPLTDKDGRLRINSEEPRLLGAWPARKKCELRPRKRRDGNQPFIRPLALKALLQHIRCDRRIDQAILKLIGPVVRIVQATDVQQGRPGLDSKPFGILRARCPFRAKK
jgi:hypothetical protein